MSSAPPSTPVAARSTPKASKPPANKKKAHKKLTQASQADKYVLYQESVQCPEAEVKLLKKIFKKVRGRKPLLLREDFAGTHAVCCEWVGGAKGREAWGVDLDPEPIAWGTANNLPKVKKKHRENIHIVEGDVRDVGNTPKADLIAAMNFSYFIFKTRDALRAYFKAAYENLKDDGMLFCDIFGGHEVFEDAHQEETPHDGFSYVWDQHKFNPITHDFQFYIHFTFPDGSALKKAFSYDWRLWSIPEVGELMREAGFDEVQVYWEQADDQGEGNGVYKRQAVGDADPAWLAYVVGVKNPAS